MKKGMKAILVMSIVTVIYFSAVLYVHAIPNNQKEVVLAADELDTQPPFWRTPEELGIKIYKEQQGWIQVLAPKEIADQLQAEQPIFKYKDKFYQILPLWVTPSFSLPEQLRQGLVPAGVGIGAGWIFVGAYIYKDRKETKKKITSAGLVCLLIALACINIPILSVTAASEVNLWVTPGLPKEVLESEPQPLNGTENYLNTTNLKSDVISPESALDEIDNPEGSRPLYVLVFGDEEERSVIRSDFVGNWFTWDNWAKWQIERGDEALIANFGIDIRILDFLAWDSDDSINSFYELWYELERDTKSYLGKWYDGAYWDNHVDAIIGITAQATIENIAGLAPGPAYLDQGRIFILLKWQIYWADDNLVQHEVSHLFYAPDHNGGHCCAMAYHTHFQTFIWENGLWWVFADVACGYTSYHWCTSCTATINSNLHRYHPDPVLGDVIVSRDELWLPPFLCTAISAISMVALASVKRYKKNRES